MVGSVVKYCNRRKRFYFLFKLILNGKGRFQSFLKMVFPNKYYSPVFQSGNLTDYKSWRRESFVIIHSAATNIVHSVLCQLRLSKVPCLEIFRIHNKFLNLRLELRNHNLFVYLRVESNIQRFSVGINPC